MLLGLLKHANVMPRLHLIHVARIQVVSISIHLYPLSRRLHVGYPVSAIKLSSRLHVSTCIRE